MLKKYYTRTRNFCRVTFKLPPEVHAQSAAICGDFNGWDTTACPMKRLKDGGFSVTITLPAPNTYQFRYFLDGERWENDWDADGYDKNAFGGEDSVVRI